jgi:hypothetical protein
MYAQLPNPSIQSGTTRPSPPARVHWKAPLVMLSSMVLGIAFTIGHHLFYQSLHHKPTGDAVFAQQINTGIGTAFAFIVRMFLVISVGTAYLQLFWHQVKKRPTSVSQLDTLNSITVNAFQFLRVQTLARFPVMALVALILWYVLEPAGRVNSD